MQLDARKYLYDILQAADLLASFSHGKTLDQYQRDPLLRSAIERQFEITGEALNQLLKLAPDIASRITEHRRIVAFRNILIHGYAEVDARIVWGVLEQKLPVLREEVRRLLAEEK